MTKANKILCDANIDPAQTDIDDQPRKRRSVRRKREPLPEMLRPWVGAAYRRKKGRSCPPGAMFEIDGVGPKAIIRIVSPHDDDLAWENMIADAFGTRSWSVMKAFLEHLRELAPESFDHTHQMWKPDEGSLNAALAIVHASRPRDELDAMLCAQAVATHWMQMKASKSVLGSRSSYINDRTAATCANLSRAFGLLVERIDRRKRKPRLVKQQITVRRESHYHIHKHVYLEGGAVENGGQPLATEIASNGAGKSKECSALPSPQSVRSTLPLARGERQARVPDARGTRRSTEG